LVFIMMRDASTQHRWACKAPNKKRANAGRRGKVVTTV